MTGAWGATALPRPIAGGLVLAELSVGGACAALS